MPAADAARPPVVRAAQLDKRFNGLVAVRGVSFDLAPGECLGLLGPNGAGKTTVTRMVSCVSPPTSGTLEVFGLPVARFPRRIKARLGVCPQDNNLDPDLDVRRNLLVYAAYFGIPPALARRRAGELLDFVELGDRGTTPVRDLSGGMMRRLVFARSLLNEPDLLLLDEPTTGLDPQVRRDVWGYIEKLRNRGKSFILTTHYMEEAARLCDRVIIMDLGRVIAGGAPEALVAGRIGREAVEFSAPPPGLEAFLTGHGAALESRDGRTVVFPGAPEAFIAQLVQRFPGVAFRRRPANLEDVFLRLTGKTLAGETTGEADNDRA